MLQPTSDCGTTHYQPLGHTMHKPLIALPLLVTLLSACSTNDLGDSRDMTNTQKGAVIGTVSGAALGALINKNNRGKGALIGAVGCGLAGTGVGYYMDKRASDNALIVNMTSNTGFDTNSSVIKPGFTTTLDKISRVLNQYGKTTVTVTGHTDSVGSDASNQTLSEKRAQSVLDYFASKNVNPIRLAAYGRGASQPRADNATEAGRSLNRRVELLIEPVVEN